MKISLGKSLVFAIVSSFVGVFSVKVGDSRTTGHDDCRGQVIVDDACEIVCSLLDFCVLYGMPISLFLLPQRYSTAQLIHRLPQYVCNCYE